MPMRRKIIHDTSSSSSPPRSSGHQVPEPAARLVASDDSAPPDSDVKPEAMRRKIIHDTSSSSSPPRSAQLVPSDDSAPPAPERAEQAAKLVRRAAEGRVEIIMISSDESEPDSPRPDIQDQAVELPVWNPLLFAAQHGHFPTADDVPLVGVPAAIAEDPDGDDGYLWNAVPAHVAQFLDLEAACEDTSSGSSDVSEGELSPGFIDDMEPEKENITVEDVELLQRMFPHTYKCVCNIFHVHYYDVFNILYRWMSSRRPHMPCTQ